MKRLTAGGFLVILCAALVEPMAAQPKGGTNPPGYSPKSMPGSDWWRIYPWSPYNYGKNPYYNPYTAPPPYGPYYPPPYYTNEYYNGAQAPKLSPDTNQHVMVPHPTGALNTPPRDAAVIQVRVPERFAELAFNGDQTSSVGLTRYFVTPSLSNDKAYHYVIMAKWTRNGQAQTAERQVDVLPGKTSHVDFTQ